MLPFKNEKLPLRNWILKNLNGKVHLQPFFPPLRQGNNNVWGATEVEHIRKWIVSPRCWWLLIHSWTQCQLPPSYALQKNPEYFDFLSEGGRAAWRGKKNMTNFYLFLGLCTFSPTLNEFSWQINTRRWFILNAFQLKSKNWHISLLAKGVIMPYGLETHLYTLRRGLTFTAS